jgi:RHS repeat-associated protein
MELTNNRVVLPLTHTDWTERTCDGLENRLEIKVGGEVIFSGTYQGKCENTVTKKIDEAEYTAITARYTGTSVTLYGRGEAVAVSRSASVGTRGGASYLGKDILGSVRSATDDYGALEDRYEYDAFGKPYKGDFANGIGLGYTGKPYDAATGLYNYGYRDYAPEAARFTTVDPVRDGANWFAYVNNDPVNWIDPWGLEQNTYTGSSAFWGGSDGGFGQAIVTTNVTVDANTNTANVTTLATDSVFITAGATVTTTATVSVNGFTYDRDILSMDNIGPSLTNAGMSVIGATTLDLPLGYEDMNTSVVTISTFIYDNGVNVAILGTTAIEVPVSVGATDKGGCDD